MRKKKKKGNWLKKVRRELIYLDIETKGKASSLIIVISCFLLAVLITIICFMW